MLQGNSCLAGFVPIYRSQKTEHLSFQDSQQMFNKFSQTEVCAPAWSTILVDSRGRQVGYYLTPQKASSNNQNELSAGSKGKGVANSEEYINLQKVIAEWSTFSWARGPCKSEIACFGNLCPSYVFYPNWWGLYGGNRGDQKPWIYVITIFFPPISTLWIYYILV